MTSRHMRRKQCADARVITVIKQSSPSLPKPVALHARSRHYITLQETYPRHTKVSLPIIPFQNSHHTKPTTSTSIVTEHQPSLFNPALAMSKSTIERASSPSTDRECGMCYDEAQYPVPLDNCRHTFCQQCLIKWMTSNNAQRHKCPVCRAILFNDGIGPKQAPQVIPRLQSSATPYDHHSRMMDRNGVHGGFFRNNAHPGDPTLRNIDQQTRTLYSDFIFDLENVASFYRKLWRRVVRTLAPQYVASNCLITEELNTAARIMFVELLDHVHYQAVFPEDDMRDIMMRSLNGDEDAMALSRRVMQLIMIMVMLCTIMPMDINVVLGCFDLLSDLRSTLDFDVINAAVADPSGANAPVLKVVTMLLVDHNVGYVGNNLGAQWYASIEPSDQYYTKALAVKGKLDRESRTRKETFKKMLAGNEEIAHLWQQARIDDPPARQGFCARLRGHFTRNDPIREPPRTLTRNPPSDRPRPTSDLASQLAGTGAGTQYLGVQVFGLRQGRPRHDSEPLLVTPSERRQYQHQTHFAWW
ncbi:hypothetical protein FB567DRAFT_538505 [Paraphoma chrysanthemicola]|uniref:RING-type domain-containing protein n=1 Tax=Paraphoma chrysanthemicola TaxID=798071 RepID=A0A8K0QUP0_9PLEO|nr:hypothetical protein FB567DRAFT_538505 [Paraphoma chrysanthemicola]